jgi:hypothetical protein
MLLRFSDKLSLGSGWWSTASIGDCMRTSVTIESTWSLNKQLSSCMSTLPTWCSTAFLFSHDVIGLDHTSVNWGLILLLCHHHVCSTIVPVSLSSLWSALIDAFSPHCSHLRILSLRVILVNVGLREGRFYSNLVMAHSSLFIRHLCPDCYYLGRLTNQLRLGPSLTGSMKILKG